MTTTAPTPTTRGPGGSDGGRSSDPGGARPREPRPGHRVRYLVVGVVLVGSLVFLLAKGLGSALDFYLPVDQAVAQQATLGTRTINVEGVVEPDSIRSTRVGVDFVVGSGATRLQVDNAGSPPELFQPNIPVIAVGHFDHGTFESDQILVKHSATYIAQHPNRVTAPNGTRR